ncbi:MAG: DUF6142 family protein [Lachnospiraceae bacterium]
MAQKNNYMFTSRKHSQKAIMSINLGVISLFSILLSIYYSYRGGINSELDYGMVGFLVTIFSIVGVGLGIAASTKTNTYKISSFIGIGINIINLGIISFILYSGANGL